MHDRKLSLFKYLACALPALAVVVGLHTASAQAGAGAQFGARDPRTCGSFNQPAKGAPTAAQLRQYFICEQEKVTQSFASGQLLYLVTGVTVQVGSGRPFNISTDSWQDVDPSKTVYPIRGAYTWWQCGPLGHAGYVAGHSCQKLDQPHAAGICFMDTFGDWHCKFNDRDHTAMTNGCPEGGGAPSCLLPAPTGN